MPAPNSVVYPHPVTNLHAEATGELGYVLHQKMTALYPICRSITCHGVRQTLELIGQEIPLESNR